MEYEVGTVLEGKVTSIKISGRERFLIHGQQRPVQIK